MDTRVRDEQGVGMLLMMEGVPQEQFSQARKYIQQQFEHAAEVVYKDMLNKPLPDAIMIDLGQNNSEEMEEGSVELAHFNAELSNDSHLFFTVRDIVIRRILDQVDLDEFESIVYHEMMHAADISMLAKSRKIFAELQFVIDEEVASHNRIDYANRALYRTLAVFDKYRGEGVAILGEHLLQKRKLPTTPEMIGGFLLIYVVTMMKAKNVMDGEDQENHDVDNWTSAMAYGVAAAILLLVLDIRGDVDEVLINKVYLGLNTGRFDLTDEETYEMLRSSFSLSLADYIQGLMLCGDKLAPIQPLLEFCAKLQRDWEDDNMEKFAELVNQPESTQVFNEAMEQIMGCVIPEQEIDKYYESFVEGMSVNSDFFKMQEKVTCLYHIVKQDDDAGRRKIAQWALTYLFDSQDVIHDDIVCLGYVDDMMVIDYALKVLEK